MISPSSLLDALRHGPLLAADQLAEAESLARSLPAAQAVVAELARRGWLTEYQGKELNAGRGFALVVEKYVLLERLGKGGMGEVLRARHQFMGRDVALKRMKEELLDSPELVERFLREVRATAALRHAHVVQVYDAGESNGVYFLAMELLSGVDLAHHLHQQGGRLRVASALEYVRQACEGMQHAHEKGLVHRDLKPGNLMRTDEGQIKILDMGLALVASASSLTRTGDFCGTPDYAAPEQVTDASRVDVRADVYSLGCTLYHLLTGRTPYADVERRFLLNALLSDQEPPRVEELRPEVPRRVAEVVRQMMAKDRERRHKTPGEAGAELASFLRKRGESRQGERSHRSASPVAAPASQSPETDARRVSVAGRASLASGLVKRVEPLETFANSIGMRFVLVKPGKFLMGSPKDDEGRFDDETRHEVTLTKAFYLGVCPVTQGQWKTVMGNNPSYFCASGGGKDKVSGMNTDDFPVEQVSWQDVQDFLKKLTATNEEARTGRDYRLPTEAEWEYSCRNSGTYQKYHFGDSISKDDANFGRKLGRTCKVGSYPANAIGLHDMHGNVWEWCADGYGKYPTEAVTDPSGPSGGALRVSQGGSWNDSARYCRSADRNFNSPGGRSYDLGFRAALVPAQ